MRGLPSGGRRSARAQRATVPKLDLSRPPGSGAFHGPDHVDDRADFEHRAGQLQPAYVAAKAPGIRICLRRKCVPAECLVRLPELAAVAGHIGLPGGRPKNNGMIPFIAGAGGRLRSGLLRGEFAGGDSCQSVKLRRCLDGRLDAVRCQPC